MKIPVFFRLFPLLLFVSVSYSTELMLDSDYSGLNGYVKDAKSKETLIGASVIVEGTKFGAKTNKNGYYTISNIPDGEFTISVSYIGYEKLQLKMKFVKGAAIRKDFLIKSGGVVTEGISVSAEREVEKRQISISKVNIPVEQIKEIRIGGESDVFRTLQYLPGVLTSSQVSSGLYIRGGSPDQNLVLLDGSTVYNPTHLFGFISSFNTDAIKDVELVKGGFDAEYGGRMSAVLNLTQKDGNREEFGGIASLGAISSRLSLEGPLGNGSFFVSGRRTYLDLILGIFPEDPETPFPDFNFYDINLKVTQDIGDNDKISASAFFSNDNLMFSSFGLDIILGLGNKLSSLKWTHIYNEHFFSTFNFSYSQYFNNIYGDQSGYQFLIDNAITDYTAKANFEWFASDDLTLKFGYEGSMYDFKYLQNFTGDTDTTQQGSEGGQTNLDVEDVHNAIYGQFKWSLTDEFSVQGGLRVNHWKLSNLLLLDPRISARYYFTDRIALKAAYGIFHQNLRLATQPDFSFFDTWLPTDSTVPQSHSEHFIVSLETKLVDEFDLNFDFYYKTFENLSELNTATLRAQTPTVSDVFFIGNAYSYGAEVFLQKKFGKFTGWLGYAIGFINAKFDSINNGVEFRPKYDRTHDFKVVGMYKHNADWEFGATFLFQSGQSYTGATSRFQVYLPDQNYGRGKIFPSQRYGLRLPPSHQLNLSAIYNFKMWGLDAKAILDIYNVYSRRDILVRFYNTREPETIVEDVRLIPILPSISIEVKF